MEDDQPTPLFAALAAEQLDYWFGQLTAYDDDQGTLRQIAKLRLLGCTNDELASRLELPKRTVERKLNLIRRIWSQEEGA